MGGKAQKKIRQQQKAATVQKKSDNKVKWIISAIVVVLLIIVCIFAFSKCYADTKVTSLPQFESPKAGDEVAVMTVKDYGTIKMMFFKDKAPKAVENFITHSKNNYYNGVKFHRVMKDFMIQGGDPLGSGKGGESIWGKPFNDEFSPSLHNFRGALSMANSGKNTNGSQFFIVQAGNKNITDSALSQFNFPEIVNNKYKEIGGTPWLDNVHTVFGQVYEGMDIVDRIAAVNVNSSENMPLSDVIIEKIEIVKYQ